MLKKILTLRLAQGGAVRSLANSLEHLYKQKNILVRSASRLINYKDKKCIKLLKDYL